MKIEHTNLSWVNNTPYRVQWSSVVGLLVLPMFDKLPWQDVSLKLCPCDEVVILTIHLPLFPWPTGICNRLWHLQIIGCQVVIKPAHTCVLHISIQCSYNQNGNPKIYIQTLYSTHTNTHTCSHTCACKPMHEHVHTRTYSHACAHARARTHTHIIRKSHSSHYIHQVIRSQVIVEH